MRRLLPFLVLFAIGARSVRADPVVTTSNPFLGVTLVHQSDTSPRSYSLNLIFIDPKAPGISFKVTEPLDPKELGTPQEGSTTLETTRAFVAREGAQIGINANFFRATLGNPVGQVNGVAASNGVLYSSFLLASVGVNLGSNNLATFLDANPADPTGQGSIPSVTYQNAFAGLFRLIRGGQLVNNPYGSPPVSGQTAFGTTADGRIVLATSDGDPTHASGLTLPELASVLLNSYGVVDAISLDGGGSTTLVFADPTARVVNVPYGLGAVGTERPVGANLAVFARPVPIPEPGSALLALTGCVPLLLHSLRAARPIETGQPHC